MKIGIEGQRLFRKKKAGMDIVALELIHNLQAIDQENEYVVFVKPDEDRECLQESPNFKIVEVPGGNYMSWEQRSLPQAVKAEGVELLHCTSNTAPLFSPVPLVLTLHDIIFLENLGIKGKGTMYQRLGKVYRRYLVPQIVRKCERIITVSRQEKDRILKRFRLPQDDVQAIYNGVSPDYHKVADEQLLTEVKMAYGLPERFVLFLGNRDPKKNMEGAIEAFGQYAETDERACLVVTAIERPVIDGILAKLGRPKLISKIILPGFAPKAYLPVLYSLATVYMYPSLREGFGLPILEAFGCGAPVITADTSSMPEVAGDAAMLIDPTKPEAIAKAMRQLMTDEPLRQEKIAMGYERVKEFSWKKMAQEVLQLYHEVLGVPVRQPEKLT